MWTRYIGERKNQLRMFVGIDGYHRRNVTVKDRNRKKKIRH